MVTIVELELFQSDPAEFVRKCHDPIEDFWDPRNGAVNTLQSLARYRQKDVLPRFIPFIQVTLLRAVSWNLLLNPCYNLQNILSEYNNCADPSNKDYRKKEGVIVAIGSVLKVQYILELRHDLIFGIYFRFCVSPKATSSYCCLSSLFMLFPNSM